MASDELGLIKESINKSSDNSLDFLPPYTSEFEKICKQRFDQRDKLLNFAIRLSWASFFLVFAATLAILRYRFLNPGSLVTVFSSGQFEVLAVSVFGQIISVILVITKSLWQDDPYIDLLAEQYKDAHSNSTVIPTSPEV